MYITLRDSASSLTPACTKHWLKNKQVGVLVTRLFGLHRLKLIDYVNECRARQRMYCHVGENNRSHFHALGQIEDYANVLQCTPKDFKGRFEDSTALNRQEKSPTV
jgi:hypothetical protein